MTTMYAKAIRVEDRFRKELGDIAPLAESIEEVGLLHPIVVSEDGRLIAGARRLEACKSLGIESVPVTIAESWADASAALIAERDENTCRKAMTASELAALGRALEEIYKPAARARQGTRTDLTSGSTDPEVSKARVGDQVGEALGVSRRTYERIQEVAKAAEDESLPAERREAAKDALAAMDGGRAIRAAHDEYRESHVQQPPLGEMTERQLGIAQTQMRRVVQMLSGLQGWADGLDAIDVQKVRAVMEPTEIEEWTRSLGQSLKTFRRFQSQLQNGKAA